MAKGQKIDTATHYPKSKLSLTNTLKEALRPAALAVAVLGLAQAQLYAQEHFNAKGAQASRHTAELQQALRESLPFEDTRDFEESRRGFIAEPASKQILGAQGNVVWDMARYDFLLTGEEIDSMHLHHRSLLWNRANTPYSLPRPN